MARSWVIPLALVCLLASVARGQERMIIEHRETVAPDVTEYEFEVPAFSIEHQVRLSLEVRIDAPQMAGSNPWLIVTVNGHTLTKPDLLNKTDEFRTRGGTDLTWSHYSRWRVLYSPDFEAAIKQIDSPYAAPDADPYRFVWDITDYVQPGRNKLTLEHLKILPKPSTMVMRNVKVEVGRPISRPAAEEVAPKPTGPLPTYVARRAQPVAMAVRLAGSGAIHLGLDGGHSFAVITSTSLPGGQWHETAAAESGEELTAAGQVAQTGWTAGNARVERRVTLHPDHLKVDDTVTNMSDDLIGVMLRHQATSASGVAASALLAGRELVGGSGSAYNARNPSAYSQWSDIGLGLVAEDDIFRIHLRAFAEPDGPGLADERLGLEAGASVTLEWSIYPVPGGDYWDFVNAVRRTWDVNFTIPGQFYFFYPPAKDHTPESYAQWLRSRDIDIVCGGIAKYADGKYAHGTGILFAPEFVAAEAEAVAKIKQGAPEVTVMAYFHGQLCTEPEAETKYADSVLLDANGEHLSYPYSYRIPLYLPTLENSYGKALPRFVDCLLGDIGVDGIYWDEMTYSVLQWAPHGPWDGYSVAIDPDTHAVTGTMCSVTLLMQPLHVELVRRMREGGRFMMANGQAATRTMTELKIVRFVETGTYQAIRDTHLGCPIGLGNHHEEKTQADAALTVRRILEQGAVTYGHYYIREPVEWNYTSVMWPITPAELHEGVVLGEERIHTARSGRFGFPDGAVAEVYVVDGEGARVTDADVVEVTEDGRRLYEVRMPGDHFAVLVKR